MRIQHNIMAMNAYRNLGMNNKGLSKNLEKLSSGYRINRAGDDAAGLAISEKMRSQIAGLDQAQKNAQSGINMIQTAEGALTEVHDMLNRMVTLATQAANGTYAAADQQKIQSEINALTQEIDRIATESNFNGQKLLDGSLAAGDAGEPTPVVPTGSANVTITTATPASFKLGAVNVANNQKGDATVTVAYKTAGGGSTTKDVTFTLGTSAGATATALQGALEGQTTLAGLFDVSTAGGLITLTTQADKGQAAVTNVTVKTSAAGKLSIAAGSATAAVEAGLFVKTSWDATGDKITLGTDEFAYDDYSTADKLKTAIENAGYNVAEDNNNWTFTKDAVDTSGLTLQIGANTTEKITVNVADMGAESLGIKGNDGKAISVASVTDANTAIKTINDAIELVSVQRSNLGAYQNRLEHTINNLGVMEENIQDAEATIRDTDIADEMMAYTKNNILIQSAQAMLAQANQVPQGVLQLMQ